ncbi:hypothetical protein LK07_16235 [Streptomyces pluripotens]|uniref:Uncharacterized protein n=1 Tax=Streptomyces pluripotens TaxID=1355015 RepID=A0A221P0N0_9ACTN|nr:MULTISPECIES: hypothetical protein [Streptomyces]ARP71066.1 hypothetical protein LK06_015100 [Streptomyces pluripotens]ASN25315.1 hypothetical protein LK07_16235 [Streptomyces pluripotens]MCH0557161.1 hypothetical protein [Streptomyces sp. MUM 16J]
MAAEVPSQGRMPGDRDERPPAVPDAVWRRFLTDTDHAIRASAPRKPSTREQATALHERSVDAVGELWERRGPWAGPAWRDVDGRARRRRVGHVLGSVAVIALAVSALSCVPAGPGLPGEGPADGTAQRSEDVPPDRVPAVTGLSTGPIRTGTAQPAPRTG